VKLRAATSCRFLHHARLVSAATQAVPYVTEAERERAKWMTLGEVVGHVIEHESCTKREALRQIRAAIGDGKLFARWEDERPRHGSPDGIVIAPDRPPRNGEQWRDSDEGAWKVWCWQRAVIRGDRLLDPRTRRPRVLLLSQFEVQQTWREQTAAPPPAKESRPKGGRPSSYETIKQKLSSFEGTNLAGAVRHVQRAWSNSDGTYVTDKTVRKWAKKVLRERKH
jgi:hypothetical protein